MQHRLQSRLSLDALQKPNRKKPRAGPCSYGENLLLLACWVKGDENGRYGVCVCVMMMLLKILELQLTDSGVVYRSGEIFLKSILKYRGSQYRQNVIFPVDSCHYSDEMPFEFRI